MSFLPSGLVSFEEYEIDRARWLLSWRGEQVPLNRKTFDLLLYLVEHADRVVGKDELLRTLWPESFVEESNLTQHIFLLRKALSRHQSGTKIIQTIPGRGYRFAAVINEQPPATDRMVISASESITRITLEEEVDTSEPAAQGLEVTQPALPTAVGKRRVYWIAAGSVVAVALCIAGWFGWQRWLDREDGPPVDIVIGPIAGSTGDAVLDQALVAALRVDLSQSPFVSLVPPSTVRDTLVQMKQKPYAEMTLALARDVCERTNSQAVLSGNIVRLGRRLLLTEEATSCVTGSVLANAQSQASSDEDLPHSIDKLAEGLRRKLGESRRSIARFDVPIFPGNTASLEALKAYSQATMEANQGKYVDAVNLMKKAVAADPNFAEAHYYLAAYYKTNLDPAAEREEILRAYSLRDSANEPMRLAIIALYHSGATQDLYEAEQNYRTWTELYPRSPAAWNGLSIVERDLGHHKYALLAVKRALSLRPNVSAFYSNLAYEQAETGDIQGALHTCELALSHGIDGDYIRKAYFQSAYSLHDSALVQQQRDWAAAHPDAIYIRMDEIEIAIAEGRFTDAYRLVPQLDAVMRSQGLIAAANNFVHAEGFNLMEAGDAQGGSRIFRSTPVDPKEQTSILGLAWAGESEAAASDLRAMQTEFPKGTIWNGYLGPAVNALIAIHAHKPQDAIAALETIRPLEGRDPLIPMLRGDAYLANGESTLAETEYRRVINGPVQNPVTEEVPLSWLGLARALAAEGNRAAAVDAYHHFFTLWAHADPDAMYLKQAKQELAALQNGALGK